MHINTLLRHGAWWFSLFCHWVVVGELHFDEITGHVFEIQSPGEYCLAVDELQENLCVSGFIQRSFQDLDTTKWVQLISNSSDEGTHSSHHCLLRLLSRDLLLLEDNPLYDLWQKFIRNLHNQTLLTCLSPLKFSGNDLRMCPFDSSQHRLKIDLFHTIILRLISIFLCHIIKPNIDLPYSICTLPFAGSLRVRILPSNSRVRGSESQGVPLTSIKYILTNSLLIVSNI